MVDVPSGWTALTWAIVQQDASEVQESIAGGANVDERTNDGLTPLGCALVVEYGEGGNDLTKMLLSHGADPNLPFDDKGSIPLCRAAFIGNCETVRALLGVGAKLSAADSDGMTPLMYAAKGGHVTVVRLLVEHGVDVKAVDVAGRNALSWATTLGDYASTAQLLIEVGADPNNRDRWGKRRCFTL